MPAQDPGTIKSRSYYHIYNKGVEKRIIFDDKADYDSFIGYLQEYLTPPKDPSTTKQSFKVRGRTFQGTPHQPKNYFNKVELIAYSLKPDHFHLLLHPIDKALIQYFIRSLCTRYSMYFNKKYKRTGRLFEGPYKSATIRHGPILPFLTHHFHHTGGFSSYAEYLGVRETQWVKPQVVLSFFEKGNTGYKYFVEKYKLDEKEKELIEKVIFDNEVPHLERKQELERREPVSSAIRRLDPDFKPRSKIPFFFISVMMFALLFTLGIRNISVSQSKNNQFFPDLVQLRPTPVVLGKKAEAKPTEEVKPIQKVSKPIVILTIKMANASSSANIRQKPATDSAKLGIALDGDTFEFVSEDQGWYEVKLADGTTGFILEEFIVKEETDK